MKGGAQKGLDRLSLGPSGDFQTGTTRGDGACGDQSLRLIEKKEPSRCGQPVVTQREFPIGHYSEPDPK